MKIDLTYLRHTLSRHRKMTDDEITAWIDTPNQYLEGETPRHAMLKARCAAPAIEAAYRS